MAGSLNSVTLIGHIGRDPEIRSFQNGGKVASFSVATSDRWKDKNTGEQKEKTEWHNVSVFAEGLVGVVEKYLRKGSKVYVSGRLETRKWQAQDGTDRYSTEVVLRQFDSKLILLDKSERDGGRDSSDQTWGSYGGSSGGAPAGGGQPPLDDAIPF